MHKYYLIKFQLLFMVLSSFAMHALYAQNGNICKYDYEITKVEDHQEKRLLFLDLTYVSILKRDVLNSNFFLNKLDIENSRTKTMGKILFWQSSRNNFSLDYLYNKEKIDNKKNWFEQLFNAKVGYIENNWQLFMFGDIDTTKINYKKNLNFAGLVGYTPDSAKYFTLYFGYRYLYQSYLGSADDKFFVWDPHLSGPLLAVAIRF